jgi:gamma-glutamyltranspeptidase
MKLPALARTLQRLGKNGIQGFYSGELAKEIVADLARSGGDD